MPHGFGFRGFVDLRIRILRIRGPTDSDSADSWLRGFGFRGFLEGRIRIPWDSGRAGFGFCGFQDPRIRIRNPGLALLFEVVHALGLSDARP